MILPTAYWYFCADDNGGAVGAGADTGGAGAGGCGAAVDDDCVGGGGVLVTRPWYWFTGTDD